MDHHEAATANAGGLRLDHVEGKLNGGGRVNRITAFFQDPDAHLRGEGIGNGDNTPMEAFLFRRGWNARRRHGPIRPTWGRQQYGDKRHAPHNMRKR